MKNKKSYVYIGLPVLGMIFYLAYIRRSAIDMVYSDYIRLINSYPPDVWNPDKFFVADLLTRIPVNFLERGLNVMIFGYSVTVDRIMGILGFGLSALVIGRYSRKKELCPVWYAAMMIVMFSLNKWEMLYNGTGWAHFLAFGLFFWNYALLDQVYEKGFRNAKKSELVLLFVLPFVITIGASGPYCAIYTKKQEKDFRRLCDAVESMLPVNPLPVAYDQTPESLYMRQLASITESKQHRKEMRSK